MTKRCPFVSRRANADDKDNGNLYCATTCQAEFPAGCLMNCGWPVMAHTQRCAVRYLCPCYNILSAQHKHTI